MANEPDGSGASIDYGERVAAAIRVNKRVLAVVYFYVVAAMLTSSLLVSNLGFGFDDRISQAVVAGALGIVWTAYYAWGIHPKIVEYADLPEER